MIEDGLRAQLAEIVGPEHLPEPGAPYDQDASESRGLRAVPDAVACPGTPQEVAAVMAACFRHGVPVVPRGGGTGFAGGAVAAGGGSEEFAKFVAADYAKWGKAVKESGVKLE